ncbi:MAG: sensor histidine kinase [Anaerolineales bacterium]|nr:sensor histidine kinase [Anaerolineales bacterium]
MIGNSLVILAGAIGGVLLTHVFTEWGVELISILLFALAGLVASVLLNVWIVRAALQPLLELRQFVSGYESGLACERGIALSNPDPDTGQLAASLSSLIEQLENSNCQLRAISGRAIHAQEAERKRIARSLHDDTGQALSTLIINLERLEGGLPVGDLETRAKLAEARRLAQNTINELRKIIHGLRPAVLDDLGLAPAIRWYARSNLEEAGIQVEIDAPEEPLPLTPEQNTALFRIAQEAINNVARHSGAGKAAIHLGVNAALIRLRVEDDGRGFCAAGDQGEAIRLRQWGLVGIQERVELIGGNFSLTSAPGKGACLQVDVPLSRTTEASHGQNSHTAG